MKTRFFSLATILLVSAAVVMSSCSKNDDPYSPDPQPYKKYDTVACMLNDVFQYFDFTATTNSGETYNVVAGAGVAQSQLFDQFKTLKEITKPICKLQVQGFHPTGDYTAVKITAKMKDGVTIPDTYDVAFLVAMEEIPGTSSSQMECHGDCKYIGALRASAVSSYIDRRLASINFSVRKDGVVVQVAK